MKTIKPETTVDLYTLFMQVLTEQHRPDYANSNWGDITFTGRGFYLKLKGDLTSTGTHSPINIEHYDEYFHQKFHVVDSFYRTVYTDRFIHVSFCKDNKGHKQEWSAMIKQHLDG